MTILGMPALVLIAPLVFYVHYGGLPHFLLHTLVGVDAGLALLIVARLLRLPVSRWEGALPVALAFWAMGPDFIYVLGPYHRDWMDIFLFHVSLDEILPYAVAIETVIFFVLVPTYVVAATPSQAV